jgi:hypothetical protein
MQLSDPQNKTSPVSLSNKKPPQFSTPFWVQLGICISYSALPDKGANKTNTNMTANNLIIE